MRVVYSDNQLLVTGGDGPLETLFPSLADLATERFRAGPAMTASPERMTQAPSTDR
jgi:hypothetical protein